MTPDLRPATVRPPRLTLPPALAFAPYGVVSAVHLSAMLSGAHAVQLATKGMLIPALVVAVVVLVWRGPRRRRRSTIALLLLGLLLSWVGDVTFDHLVVGLTFFLLAQLAYIAAFLSVRRRASWWGLLAIPWFVGLLAFLAPYLGPLLPALIAYGLALGGMAALSSRGSAITVAGAVLFVASDSLLAVRLFTPMLQSVPAEALIMVLYLAAQGLLALGLLRAARLRDAPA